MKSKLKLKALFVSLLLVSHLNILFAQETCDNWNPEATDQIMKELNECCADIIEVNDDQLIGFLTDESIYKYKSSIKSPCPLETSTSSVELNYRWEIVPEALRYAIRYMNLRTGEIRMTETQNTQFVLLNPNRDYYLFLFSTITDGKNSFNYKSGNFIIIDKKIIIRVPTEPETRQITRNDINAELPSTFEPLRISPNPSSGAFAIEYNLSEAQEVSISLFDVLGRNHHTIQTPTWQERGAHRLTVGQGTLPLGWYQCVLKTNKEQKHLSLLIVE